MNKLYLFDLDRTLLTVSLSHRFFLHLFQKGTYSFRDLSYAISTHLLLKMRKLSLRAYHDRLFSRFFFGRSYDFFYAEGQHFIKNNVEKWIYSPALKLLDLAQSQGATIALASSSPDFLTGPVAEHFGIAKWSSTRYTRDGGGCVCAVRQFLEGSEKAAYAKQLTKDEEVDLNDLVALTDSIWDLPLLQLAGQQIAVQPDRHLKKIALNKGWTIV